MIKHYYFTWPRILKWIIHRWTSMCEIERLCHVGCHDWKMSYSVILSIQRSKALEKHVLDIIQLHKIFDTSTLASTIISQKNIRITNQNLTLPNLKHCLNSLRTVNVLISRIICIQNEAFKSNNSAHTSLLERFWYAMKPHCRRAGNLISEEWSELGFQGKDPSTDFRGMGILGLYQLVHLSEKHHTHAEQILLNSNHPRRYYPFAATGINMTSFVLDLLKQKRLHIYLFQRIESCQKDIFSNFQYGPSESEECIENLVSFVYDIYCDVYFEFNKFWEFCDPPSIMSFSKIFDEFKKKIYIKYPIFE